MPKLKISAQQMVAAAKQKIVEIPVNQALKCLGDANTVFVDIRDIRERERTGYIPGSLHCPRGMVEFWVDPESPYFKKDFAENKHFIFYCASGWRSALTVATLTDMGFQASHITEGFQGWQDKDGPIEPVLTK